MSASAPPCATMSRVSRTHLSVIGTVLARAVTLDHIEKVMGSLKVSAARSSQPARAGTSLCFSIA